MSGLLRPVATLGEAGELILRVPVHVNLLPGQAPLRLVVLFNLRLRAESVELEEELGRLLHLLNAWSVALLATEVRGNIKLGHSLKG